MLAGQLYQADCKREADSAAAGLRLAGVTAGNDAVVGAGCGVTRDVAAGVTVFGNPAHIAPGRGRLPLAT